MKYANGIVHFFLLFDREEQPFNLNFNPLCTVSIIKRLATRPVK